MRVFVVDDSEMVRERLIDMLSEIAGVRVIGQAKDCHEATIGIEKLKPDTVILDIRMPNGSGIDVLEKIKSGKPSPMVIMLTNYPYPQYRKICLEAGADFFFDKSTEFQEVMDVIKESIERGGPSAPDKR